MPDAKKSNAFQFILLFFAIYLGMQMLFGTFFPQANQPQPTPGPVINSVASFSIGTNPAVSIQNRPVTSESFGIGGWIQSKWCSVSQFFSGSPANVSCAAMAVKYTGTPYNLASRCPKPPVDVFEVSEPGTPTEKLTPLTATGTVVPCDASVTINPDDTTPVSLTPWKYSMFERVGTFEVRLPGTTDEQAKIRTASGVVTVPTSITRFTVVEPGIFTKAFRTFISAPFLNFLIFIASWAPGHNLGIAIILLTIVVKLLLFFPTQHALEGQKKMQLLQPKIEALKSRYKDQPAKIQEETMKLWKEYKINPFQSCLPMLIQFPVLIGLLYVIRDQSNLALSQHLIYGVYQNLPWHFGTQFLGLDLLKPDFYVMPVLLVVLQFLQMKLTFSIQKRKKKKSDIIDVQAHGKEKEQSPASAQDMQQNMMLYGLPLMIGFFAIRFPSAVAVYWGISTIFGIGQQIIVNREHLKV